MTATVERTQTRTPDAVEADPSHYSVILENDRVRVVRIQYGAGEKSVMHSHPASVIVMLTDALTRMHNHDGSSMDIPGQKGQVMWFDAIEHLPENVGGAPMEGLAIELTDRGAAAKEVQRHFYHEMDARSGAPDVLDQFFATDATVHIAGSPPLDPRGFKEILAVFYSAFPDLAHHMQSQVAEGDLAAARNVVTGTHRGNFQGIPATGRRITVDAMVQQRITNGRIVEMWVNVDMAGLMRQLTQNP